MSEIYNHNKCDEVRILLKEEKLFRDDTYIKLLKLRAKGLIHDGMTLTQILMELNKS